MDRYHHFNYNEFEVILHDMTNKFYFIAIPPNNGKISIYKYFRGRLNGRKECRTNIE